MAIKFEELRKYIARNVRLSICLKTLTVGYTFPDKCTII